MTIDDLHNKLGPFFTYLTNPLLSFLQAMLNLKTICNILGGISYKWFKIGVQLGIPFNTLKEYEKEDDPLSAVIDYWLKGNVSNEDCPISWQTLVTVLSSIGELGLAKQIMQQESIKGIANFLCYALGQIKNCSRSCALKRQACLTACMPVYTTQVAL